MKFVIFTLLVVLLVSQGESLKCYCGGIRRCSGNVETCPGPNNVCISAIITAGPSVKHFKGCYDSQGCQLLNSSPLTTAFCCHHDMCNR
uniref:UPAR/Ly6 domain-containing protein n=1 Tax=Echeneis naucrates TaxID=173247 RepID=A0A665T9F4_ECHNA